MNTPKSKISRTAFLDDVTTPMIIPPSPQLLKLGYGTGVQVYRIERSPCMGANRSPWAVKRTRRDGHNQVICDRLTEEAELLKKLVHPNIVGYRGLKEANGMSALVMEDCHTSLGNILEERHDRKLDALLANDIKTVCRDMSKALDYLHNVAFILHGDIKSFNVLVKGNFEICKLCDFGVSQPVNKEGYLDLEKKPNARYVGTDLWSPPEVFIPAPFAVISTKADIFSFGLVIYECISLMPPHTWVLNDEKSDDELDESKTDNDVIEINDDSTVCSNGSSGHSFNKDNNADDTVDDDEIDNTDIDAYIGTRPPLPESTFLSDDYNQVVEVFFLCTNENPEDRPTAQKLAQIF